MCEHQDVNTALENHCVLPEPSTAARNGNININPDTNTNSIGVENSRLNLLTTWRRQITRTCRKHIVNEILNELQRIRTEHSYQALRTSACRRELYAWKRSTSKQEYINIVDTCINKLRQQGDQSTVSSSMSSGLSTVATVLDNPNILSDESCRTTSRRRLRMSRDDRYFHRLQQMKTQYRDDVAIVFRELSRVNSVLQHGHALRGHLARSPNGLTVSNLDAFLTNLKKIMRLLEQRPDEMNGLIPPRKRTLQYLNVLDRHLQMKVLPILQRLRCIYATVLRSIAERYCKRRTACSRTCN
jgi:hypothetical protein